MTQGKVFDRQYYLDILNKRALGLKENYRQNIAFIGDEFIGKTSIIFKFLDKFYDNRIITAYLEIRPEPINSFVKRFIGTLLYNFLSKSTASLKEELDYLILKSEKYIPKSIGAIKSILNKIGRNKKTDIFTELFTLCETIKQETGKSCIVILDEFQNLENIFSKNIFREWSRLLVTQKDTMYIIVSSQKFKTKSILSKDLSLLFGNFEVINVEPFDIEASEKYIDELLGNSMLEWQLKNFIVQFSAGHPFYIKTICEALSKAESNNLIDALQMLLFDSGGILNQKFSNYLRQEGFRQYKYNNDCLSILYLISCGTNKIKDIAHILHKQKNELLLRINHLAEMDALMRSGDFLKISDHVFSFWIRFVYQEKMHSLTFDAKAQKEKFRQNLENAIQDFYHNTKKPLFERLFELLGLFGNETVQLERKRVRLNHFREIKPLEFSSQRLRLTLKQGLICRCEDALWILAFKDGVLTEEEISEFAKECKKYRQKTQRKVLVTLKNIDHNARLKAMEEKIWTWDINSLNQMLDLYSKPWVIL